MQLMRLLPMNVEQRDRQILDSYPARPFRPPLTILSLAFARVGNLTEDVGT